MFEKHRSLFTRALLLVALVFAGWWLLRSPEGKLPAATTVSYSELLNLMQNNRIDEAKFETSSSRLLMTLKPVEASAGKPAEPAKQVVAVLPVGDTDTINKLAAGGVAKVDIIPRPQPSNWPVFLPLLGILILVGVMIWLHRRSQNGAGGMDKAMGFGKSKSEAVDPSQNPIRLKDVAGCDEAKAEVEEVVNFLKNPSDYHRLGGKVPRGVLLAGPPGTGKTLLAKAVAGEAGVPFFFVSGSEFVEMFVGVGASRVRDMFAQAKAQAPAIIFVDEIDAVGARRGAGSAPGGGGDSEREQTLNQMLVEMDGFRPNEGIIVLAATNRPEMLDPALLRAGRFDREVRVDLPDREGRAAILALHARTVPVDIDVDWDIISRGTPGFSGADLANLINEAALKAAREKAVVVNLFHLEWARDRVMMGAEKQGGMKNEKERRIVAYHEAGHALVARFSEHAEPVHKITIVPRGRSLGLTMQLPREDSYNHDRDMLLTNITVLMGGRAAEDVALGTSTVGASNDFARAASLARRMVASWGMSPEMGPVSIDGESGTPLGYDNGWSESTKRRVDKTVEALLRAEYERAKDLLSKHRSILESVALALLEHETLDAGQFEKLVVQGLDTKPEGSSSAASTPTTDARLAF